jgi:hypothetical protein
MRSRNIRRWVVRSEYRIVQESFSKGPSGLPTRANEGIQSQEPHKHKHTHTPTGRRLCGCAASIGLLLVPKRFEKEKRVGVNCQTSDCDNSDKNSRSPFLNYCQNFQEHMDLLKTSRNSSPLGTYCTGRIRQKFLQLRGVKYKSYVNAEILRQCPGFPNKQD